MLEKGKRYCDCCGIKLNKANNKCGYELCDKCNERLERECKEKSNDTISKH